MIRNISYTRRGVSSDIQTLRSKLKNESMAEFLTNFEVFGHLMKLEFRVYDITFQTNRYLKRKSSLKLSKFHSN